MQIPVTHSFFRCSAFKLALLPLAGFAASSLAVSAQTLISHYQLNGNTTDSGSIGADGTLYGSAAYTSDAPGNYTQSLDLTPNSAGNNYMEANTGTSYDGLTALTLTLWVNIQGTLSNNERFVSTLTPSPYDGFDLRVSNNHSPSGFNTSFNVNTINNPAVSGNFSANDSWAFIAVTYDSTLGSNQVSFYTGNESTAAAFLNSGNQTGALDPSSLLRIGGTPAAPTSDRTPPAYISDVRVYDGVLNLSEIENVRNAVFAIPEPSSYAAILGMGAVGMALATRRRNR
ncbi:LamG-like jellyroll fold domain-containing protein [Puniceicoccus vermicola]|uniref:PEP-CTERM sorting domain-containing protein n=1 Tax=Puniceicoccus vermicola TaxID=388746 RepID=A0A7X1B1G9_9BACT|nr:LamG-like jellyroll fold domain-containing protein [Puniceicoccus vermicola]MBC2603729.1 PEP-CTERM sorting domain-containing protein [Puniceicoccus vermicola]